MSAFILASFFSELTQATTSSDASSADSDKPFDFNVGRLHVEIKKTPVGFKPPPPKKQPIGILVVFYGAMAGLLALTCVMLLIDNCCKNNISREAKLRISKKHIKKQQKEDKKRQLSQPMIDVNLPFDEELQSDTKREEKR